jgi:hypothetical protein
MPAFTYPHGAESSPAKVLARPAPGSVLCRGEPFRLVDGPLNRTAHDARIADSIERRLKLQKSLEAGLHRSDLSRRAGDANMRVLRGGVR